MPKVIVHSEDGTHEWRNRRRQQPRRAGGHSEIPLSAPEYRCGMGKCATCTSRIIAGAEQLDEPNWKEKKVLGDEKLAEGYRLVCPASHLRRHRDRAGLRPGPREGGMMSESFTEGADGIPDYPLLIGGEWVAATGGASFEKPQSGGQGRSDRSLRRGHRRGCRRAVDAAAAAFAAWRATPVSKRAAVLEKAADWLEARADKLWRPNSPARKASSPRSASAK